MSSSSSFPPSSNSSSDILFEASEYREKSEPTEWHSSVFNIPGNCVGIPLYCFICPMVGLIWNRYRWEGGKNGELPIMMILSSVFCGPCCECILRKQIAEKFNHAISPLILCLNSFSPGICCSVWQDKFELDTHLPTTEDAPGCLSLCFSLAAKAAEAGKDHNKSKEPVKNERSHVKALICFECHSKKSRRGWDKCALSGCEEDSIIDVSGSAHVECQNVCFVCGKKREGNGIYQDKARFCQRHYQKMKPIYGINDNNVPTRPVPCFICSGEGPTLVKLEDSPA